ncbi:MAG: hypothetical protein CVU89_01155 [Firmicutes bacterium HGW-Firmicutes-14]|jgi:hypothetical protein|nr:MAG: hypothetical protein CVU89_01155 [Firmicutes bacterium HGW-Firmicutes-14]
MMAASTVFRQLLAVLFGTFAWWYFYTVEPIETYPAWLGVIVAAFIITLVVTIISENILLGLLVITAVYVVYGPGLTWSQHQFLPLFGGVVAASAIWKII